MGGDAHVTFEIVRFPTQEKTALLARRGCVKVLLRPAEKSRIRERLPNLHPIISALNRGQYAFHFSTYVEHVSPRA
jgi:hypothetical protein